MAFFVTVQAGERHRFLAGPFNTKGVADRHVQPAIKAAYEIDRASHWYAFGTARVRSGPLPVGLLNEMLGLPTDGTRTGTIP